jgi:transposase
MIVGRSDLKVVLVAGPIDFRAGINRLAALVSDALRRDPYCGDVFVFRSKRRTDRLKLIHFDGSGMILATKWLEAGQFVWPPVRDGVITLTSAQMTLLIGGMDWTRLQEIPVRKPELAG